MTVGPSLDAAVTQTEPPPASVDLEVQTQVGTTDMQTGTETNEGATDAEDAGGGAVGAVGAGTAGAGGNDPNLTPRAVRINTLNAQEQLFEALFYRVAVAYARTFQPSSRRFIEFVLLMKVS